MRVRVSACACVRVQVSACTLTRVCAREWRTSNFNFVGQVISHINNQHITCVERMLVQGGLGHWNGLRRQPQAPLKVMARSAYPGQVLCVWKANSQPGNTTHLMKASRASF